MFSSVRRRVAGVVAGLALTIPALVASAQGGATPVDMPDIDFPVDLGSIATAAFVAFGAIIVAIIPVKLGIAAVKWCLRKMKGTA